jgi:hypothetical protein
MTERAASLQSIITDGVQHLSPPPRVTALSIILSADTYDVDEARGRSSSFAGPNELFYRAMIQDEREPEGVISTTKLPSDSLPALIARYAFVQVVETDCCATADGWLDDLLKPMKDDPDLLISGSRGRGACWTGAEYGGCKPMVDPAIPHAHLRDHINGNAMYRVGRDLTQLIASARDIYGSTVPFDVALHLISGGDRAADNGRSYSVMGLPVDESRFVEASYYGTTNGVISFVHTPRRLRAPSLQAMLRRLDSTRPVTVVVVVPPRGVDQVMLRRLHESLVRTKEARNAVYLVADEGEYALVANVAPMRVLMMGGDGQVAPGPDNLLSSLSSMARAGLATFTMGLDATVLQPYTHHLMALVDEQPGKAWVVAGSLSPRAEGAMSTSTLTLPGLLFVPAGEQAGKFLDAWAEQATHAATPVYIPNLATRHHLSLAQLPPDLFPQAFSYVGPLWTDEARRIVATIVSLDMQQPSPATPAALSALGLWQSSSSSTPFHCANYSILGTSPLPLTNLLNIHRSLSTRSAFASFVRDKAIACVVLPGFRLATTGNVVPDGVVVGKEGGTLLAKDAVVTFTSLADLKAVGKADGGLGDMIPFEHVKRTVATSGRSSGRGKPARRSAACAAFGIPAGTSCFSPQLATLVDAAIAALPPLYHCALDTRRTHQEVALLSLEGRLGEVGRLMWQMVGGRGRLPILLTGSGRHATGGQLTGISSAVALPNIITLADLTAPPSASLDPISRLVRFGTIESTTSLASSPWADMIEYAVCQGAEVIFDLADEYTGVLSAPFTPSSVLTRLAALIPPAVLAADLTALARWLDRSDRPSLTLAVQWARLDLADSPPIMADDFEDAVVAPSLGLARAVGAKAVTLPTLPVTWSALVGERALCRAYTTHAALLPGSVGGLLGLPAGIRNNISLLGPHRLYPASVDVLHSPVHRSSVRALERALSVGYGKAQNQAAHLALQLPAAVSPAQHGRLKHFAAGAQSVVFSFLF